MFTRLSTRAILALLVCRVNAIPQAVPQVPRFEVASIRPIALGGDDRPASAVSSVRSVNDSMHFFRRGVTLAFLIQWAYDVQSFQVMRAPGWLDSDRYDVNAECAEAANKMKMRLMLRTLLAERFNLSIHTAKTTIPGYALVVAKGGPKFGTQFHQISDGTDSPESVRFDASGRTVYNETMAHFAAIITSAVNAPVDDSTARLGNIPVVDRTSLVGTYEIAITWHAGEDPSALLEREVGLKLVSSRSEVETLVIDRVERIPTEN